MPLVSKGTVTGAAQQGQCSHAAHWLATVSYNISNTTILYDLHRNSHRLNTDSVVKHYEFLIDLQILHLKFIMLTPFVCLIICMVGNAFAILVAILDCCFITAVPLMCQLQLVINNGINSFALKSLHAFCIGKLTMNETNHPHPHNFWAEMFANFEG